MSEKRFQIFKVGEYEEEYFVDTEQEIIDEEDYFEVKSFATMSNEQVVVLLNEQQSTINELKEENKKLIEEWEFSFRTEMAHHRFAEKELQEKIREKQATINKLKEENEQLKKRLEHYKEVEAMNGDGKNE